MLNVVLYEPRIPQNTGNVIRMCANTGATLHLVEPLGFELDAARVKRAGLDYRDMAVVRVHPDLDHVRSALPESRWFATSSHATTSYAEIRYSRGDVVVFGPEPTGLPEEVMNGFPPQHLLRIPMMPGCRSLNLSNAAAVVTYEAWRQSDFAGS